MEQQDEEHRAAEKEIRRMAKEIFPDELTPEIEQDDDKAIAWIQKKQDALQEARVRYSEIIGKTVENGKNIEQINVFQEKKRSPHTPLKEKKSSFSFLFRKDKEKENVKECSSSLSSSVSLNKESNIKSSIIRNSRAREGELAGVLGEIPAAPPRRWNLEDPLDGWLERDFLAPEWDMKYEKKVSIPTSLTSYVGKKQVPVNFVRYWLSVFPGDRGFVDEFQKFLNYWERTGRKNVGWFATWRNWVLNCKKYSERRR